MPPGRVLVPGSGQCRAPSDRQPRHYPASADGELRVGITPDGGTGSSRSSRWASYAWPRRWSCFSIEGARRLRGPRRLARHAAPTPQRRAGHPRRGRRRVGRGARRRPRPRRQPRPRARPRPGRPPPGRPRPPAPRLRPRAPRSFRPASPRPPHRSRRWSPSIGSPPRVATPRHGRWPTLRSVPSLADTEISRPDRRTTARSPLTARTWAVRRGTPPR
jgi:hypothetical protein